MSEHTLSDGELTGKHLEVFYAQHMKYHSERVLKAFGADEPLPPLDYSDPAQAFAESEKRYRKALEVLFKDEPMDLPDEVGISRNYLTRLADGMAYKALEVMISGAHLDELGRIEKQLLAGAAGEVATKGKLRLPEGLSETVSSRLRELKPFAVAGKHVFRDFFSSGMAKELGVSSLGDLENFLRRAYIIRDKYDLPASVARGIGMEIAALEWMQQALEHDPDLRDQQGALVMFGGQEEDLLGGDIVVLRHGSQTFIDVKNHRPAGPFNEDELEQGYRLRPSANTWKATVWAESMEPISEDSFRLSDPAMKHALKQLLLETQPKVAESLEI